MRLQVVLVVVSSVAAAPAAAHDSLAPPGAPHHWLPDEPWVQRHWVPFDERDLERALGLAPRRLEAYLYDDHRTLARLAAVRGLPADRLADHLLARWDGAADAAGAARRDHTMRLLTQGHLAQHVLFHPFHLDFDRQGGPAAFGLPAPDYWRLREWRFTPLEIARLAGVPAAVARQRMAGLLRASRDEGVRQGLTPAAQADRMLARQLGALPCWMRRPLGTRDAGNPYGKNRLLHPHHGPEWPATPAERRAGERRVERVRRAVRPSCWGRPPAWTWPASEAMTSSRAAGLHR